MTVWVDVVARARGLASHLAGPADIQALAHASSLRQLDAMLAARHGRPVPDTEPSPAAIEDVERRHLGAQVRLLARWAATRADLLAPLYEDEDCRSLRAILRGSVGHVPAPDRLAGLIPTPALSFRALTSLAACESPASIAALLSTWGNPYGPALLAETTRQQPDLFAMEHVLVETWAGRSRRAGKKGGKALKRFVSRQVDLANCWSALLVAEHGFDGAVPALFIEGGDLLSEEDFTLAATAASRGAAARILDGHVRRTPLEAVTATDTGAEERILRALTREQHDLARTEPLGAAPVVEYWLRLRGEMLAVRRIAWSIAAGVPAGARVREPVEA
jgi:hypothetical protein